MWLIVLQNFGFVSFDNADAVAKAISEKVSFSFTYCYYFTYWNNALLFTCWSLIVKEDFT